MCKQCEIKPVYEFTNKRKVCRGCFIRWFQKKVLYTIRKFKMIRKDDIVGYENKGDFREVVLEDVLKMYGQKGTVKIIKLPAHSRSQIDNKQLTENSYINSFNKFRAKRGKLPNKIAISSTTDLIANEIINNLIKDNLNKLKINPVKEKIIRPLYLFLDKEVLLYVKLNNLKFNKIKTKENKISKFINELEEKHPEVKHAVVNGGLGLS